MKLSYFFCLILQLIQLEGFAQRTIEANKLHHNAYELNCSIVFENNVCSQLMDFCWDANNIKRIMQNEDILISCTTKEGKQLISYDYTFMLMRYYSLYERNKVFNENKINFTLLNNDCSIPFIPNIIKGYGYYSFTYSANKTTLVYYQYSQCDGSIRDFFYNYIKRDVADYFELFEGEFLEYLQNNSNK